MFNKKFKKYICISVGIVGTSFVGLKALAKYKKGSYIYQNSLKEQNPFEGKKVIFVNDENVKENADGVTMILTLSIMILPLIMRTTEEALKSVPDSYREGSFGLGAGKLRTVFKIVLPSAVPGILAGVILAIGRIVGETAALIYTAGTVAQIPKNAFGSGRTLAVHMYMLSSEGLYMNQAYATAVILLILVVVINTLSGMIAKRLTKK